MNARCKTALRLAALVGVFALSLTAGAQEAAFALLRPVMQLPPATADGIGEVLLQVPAGPVPLPAGPPILKDVPSKSSPGVTVEFMPGIEVPTATGSPRMFRFQATVRGMDKAGATQLRSVSVEWGSLRALLPYWLSNTPAPALNWNVSGLPAKWALDHDRCQPVRLSATGARATGIVVTSTLTEKTTLEPLNRLMLSLDRQAAASAAALETAVNDLGSPVFLCFPSDVWAGEYQGTVNINAAEKPEGGATSVVVYASGWWYRLIGGLLLAVGCILAYVTRAWLPARVNRNLALLAAALLREDAQRVLDRLGNAPAPRTRAELTDVLAKLGESQLGNFIPSLVPSLMGTSHDSAGYKKLIDESSARLAKLLIIVKGIERAGSDASKITAIDDLVAEQTLKIEELPARIDQILKQPAPSGAPGPGATAPLPRSRQLVVEIDNANEGLWWVWGVISWGTGFVVLVLNQPGFGVPFDYLYCALWGLGVPVVGQQLTGAFAGTALGITFPPKTP